MRARVCVCVCVCYVCMCVFELDTAYEFSLPPRLSTKGPSKVKPSPPANTCVKAIKTMIRTKSGRLIEKTIYITEEDYEKMMKEGGDPSSILNKYLKPEERGTIQSWEKVPEGKPMKVRCGVLLNWPSCPFKTDGKSWRALV